MGFINTSRVFNCLGLAGLILLFLLIYVNNFAPEENFLKAYKFKLIVGFFIIFLVHYIYLGVQACKKKQWWWAVLLFIAPLPVYWAYYFWSFIREAGR